MNVITPVTLCAIAIVLPHVQTLVLDAVLQLWELTANILKYPNQLNDLVFTCFPPLYKFDAGIPSSKIIVCFKFCLK